MRIFGIIVASLLGLVFFISLGFGAEWLGVKWRGFIGPQKAEVERQIFEHTPSYIHGVRQDLARYRLEWLRTDDKKEREAIESTVRMRFAQFNPDLLEDPELYSFYRMCMGAGR